MSETNFAKCSHRFTWKKVNYIWVFLIASGIVIFGSILYLKRCFSKDHSVVEHDDNLSSSFFTYDVKSFHRVNYDLREIFEAMIDKNIVGYGGSGTVYKTELSNGETIAVKRLWSGKAKYSASENRGVINKELKTEVETLGSIKHKNIVKLYSYFSSLDFSLLVYEYMPNGNLWDAIHNGKVHLNWPTRHHIALGVARGLAYLHHDLKPPIVHRDIKTTNILLDVDYQPKVADFGIAKVLQGRGKDSFSSSHVIAGTYGYLAPEYACASKATTKCDVYSFGVVLMELLTGRKPIEAEFREDGNIIYWISTMLGHKEGVIEVLDKRVSEFFKDDMIEVLKIAIRCTDKIPGNRPNMSEVVQLLVEADPSRCDNFTSSNKTEEISGVTI